MVRPFTTQSRLGCLGAILICFGFLAFAVWTGALVGIDSVKVRHLSWFVENVIAGPMGRGVGAVVTVCVGIALAVAVYVLGSRRYEPKSGLGPSRSASPSRKLPTPAARPEMDEPLMQEDGAADRLARMRSRLAAGAAGGNTAAAAPMADEQELPEELDIIDADHVAWIKARRDPALWHEAAMAALAYRGDPHGFLPWLIRQPETDRATAGWIFLWAEGSRYLRGATDFDFNSGVEGLLGLFGAICELSAGIGFSNDVLGLDGDFETERLKCLAVIENGELAPGIVAPAALLARPFDPPRDDDRFNLDDGLIICERPLQGSSLGSAD